MLLAVALLVAPGAGTAWGAEAEAPTTEGATSEGATTEEATTEAPAAAATSCTACHGDADWFPEESLAILGAVAGGAHGAVGLSCHDCHGGNPDPALADDLDAAMDPGYEANPYRGVPERGAIPELCGSCHSDPTYMRRYDPDARVDQVAEYRTSHHGLALAEGDGNVATCIDCHGDPEVPGGHGILGPGLPDSPIHPTRVAETCRTCHSDPERMAGYTTDAGRPVSTSVFSAWSRSVHADALLTKGDLFAPTCNDCHGNHGAAPPGVDSVAFVCGQCHGREADLFRGSAKQAGFQEHNLLMAGMDGCDGCHGEPQASVTRVAHFTECATCHENHAIIRPRITMLGPLPQTPCAFCHEPAGDLEAPVAELEEAERAYWEVKARLLDEAAADGLEGPALFDQLIDRARNLPQHTRAGEAEGERRLRPEVERLYEKFRLGKTTFAFTREDGQEVRRSVSGCLDCHAAEPDLAETAAGWQASGGMLEMQRRLTAWTARAERIALEAHRGGVATGEARAAIDRAVDSQIELEVLVHSFDAGEGSAFAEKHAEGLAHASDALEAGRAAIDELHFRHRGLAASLIVILALLIALALKIRQVGRVEED